MGAFLLGKPFPSSTAASYFFAFDSSLPLGMQTNTPLSLGRPPPCTTFRAGEQPSKSVYYCCEHYLSGRTDGRKLGHRRLGERERAQAHRGQVGRKKEKQPCRNPPSLQWGHHARTCIISLLSIGGIPIAPGYFRLRRHPTLCLPRCSSSVPSIRVLESRRSTSPTPFTTPLALTPFPKVATWQNCATNQTRPRI